MEDPAEMSDSMELEDSELLNNVIKNSVNVGEKIPLEVWLGEYESAEAPFKKMALLLKLPVMCDSADLNSDCVTRIVDNLPFELLSQFMLQQSDDECVDIVILLIHVLLPHSKPKDLAKFRPLLEGIRESICSNKLITEADLESRLIAINGIGIDFLSVDDLNSLLNCVLGYCKDNVDKFPPKICLEFTLKALKGLIKVFNEDKHMNYISLSWPADLKTVVERLVRTFNIDSEYLSFCFISTHLISSIAGLSWLCAQEKFFKLFASLTTGRIRVITEDPKMINNDELASCFQLEESFIRIIESDEFDVNDELATSISKFCQEAASFCCEYLSFCSKEKVFLPLDVQFAFYRFICIFASIGGLQLINKELLTGTVDALLNVFDVSLNQRDADTARLLLMNLQDFPTLPPTTLSLLLRFIKLTYPKDKTRSLTEFTELLQALNGRKDFYTPESLKETIEFARLLNDQQVNRLLASF